MNKQKIIKELEETQEVLEKELKYREERCKKFKEQYEIETEKADDIDKWIWKIIRIIQSLEE